MTESEIRRAILEAINRQRKSARNENEIRMRIYEIERGLRNVGVDLQESQVVQAADYLASAKMLKRTPETRTTKLPAARSSYSRFTPGSIRHTYYYYTLTARAIDELEGDTEYSKKSFMPLQNIHINTTNAPVIVGSNNIVSNHVMLFGQLDELQQKISESPDLGIEERQDAASDIESVKQQLAKPNPNNKVIAMLWASISKVADLAGAGGLAIEVAKGIVALTGSALGQ